MKEKLYVILSLDVEEGGLFSGHYPVHKLDVGNVALLRRLFPLSDMGMPLTLFCAHSVFVDPRASELILGLRDEHGAELGAHLHHWSTPPVSGADLDSPPPRTHMLKPELLRLKLENLFQAAARINGAPITSFRMGRWDLKNRLWPMLAELGITVDSSICPLRAFAGGADHFLAPATPYRALLPNGLEILEAPLTQVPILPASASLWRKIFRHKRKWLDRYHFFGALSPNPFWHSAGIMRLATRLHVARGGKLLNFFLHSSELQPGGSPHTPDQKAADDMLAKIFNFCQWLKTHFEIIGITACQLPGLSQELGIKSEAFSEERDW